MDIGEENKETRPNRTQIMLTIIIKFYAYGILSNLLCLLGLLANTMTLYILNSGKGKLLLFENLINFSANYLFSLNLAHVEKVYFKELLEYQLPIVMLVDGFEFGTHSINFINYATVYFGMANDVCWSS